MCDRELKLESSQVMELHRYLTETRSKLAPKGNKLYAVSQGTKFSSITKSIRKKLQEINPDVESLYQVRASRIVLWMKQYNLREVQYRAGYSSLLSLEKYRTDKLEELKQALEKYSPF